MEAYINVRGELVELEDNLPQNLKTKLQKACEKRDAMFFSDYACGAYILKQGFGSELVRLCWEILGPLDSHPPP